MKLKFYLKGFGIGVIFATVVLSISFYSRMEDSNLSRQEIERLAAAYGMVYLEETTQEESVLQEEKESAALQETSSELDTNGGLGTTEDIESTETIEENQEAEETTQKTGNTRETTQSSENSREIETVTEVETSQKERTDNSTRTTEEIPITTEQDRLQDQEGRWEVRTVGDGTSVKETTITVSFGMYASTIAELLEETGVIEDAQEFSTYLIGKGYTRRLQAGVYTFVEGMNFDEIAGKLLWETE